MDVIRSSYRVDPIPYLLDPESMPPLLLRWIAGQFVRDTPVAPTVLSPLSPGITLKQWALTFNTQVTNLTKFKRITTPSWPTSEDDQLAARAPLQAIALTALDDLTQDKLRAALMAFFTMSTEDRLAIFRFQSVLPPPGTKKSKEDVAARLSGKAQNRLFDPVLSNDPMEKRKTIFYKMQFKKLSDSLIQGIMTAILGRMKGRTA